MFEEEIVKNIQLVCRNTDKNSISNEFDIKFIELIIINKGNAGFECIFELKIKDKKHDITHFFIDANIREKLTEINIDELNYTIELTLIIENKSSNSPYKITYILNKKWYIKNRLLLKNKEIEIKGKHTNLLHVINKIEIEKIAFKTTNIPFKTPKINHVKSNIKKYELDLHVEKLTPLLSSNEILLEQLKLAEQFIDNALVLNLSEVVLIHGIGDGVLKKALHGFLKNHAMVIRFHNNYSPKYGYGATFVTL